MLRRFTLFLLWVWAAVGAHSLAPALDVYAQDGDGITAVITAPTDGQQLFGPVSITGSASHPSEFDYYTLEYDALGDSAVQWLLVQPPVRQQVPDNGELGVWNINVVPDGIYQLRLRVFLTDGQIGEFVVNNLRVANNSPTPMPTTAGLQPGPQPGAPTAGPSPTSPIVQPPSNNPAGVNITGAEPVDNTPVPAFGPTSGEGTRTTRLNTGRIRDAFCSGVYLTLVIFGIMLAYRLVHGRIQRQTRRILWQMDDEPHDHEPY